MKTTAKLFAAALALVGTLTLASTVWAQVAPPDHGGMMGRMSQMMDQCSRMMPGTTDQQVPKIPDQSR